MAYLSNHMHHGKRWCAALSDVLLVREGFDPQGIFPPAYYVAAQFLLFSNTHLGISSHSLDSCLLLKAVVDAIS